MQVTAAEAVYTEQMAQKPERSKSQGTTHQSGAVKASSDNRSNYYSAGYVHYEEKFNMAYQNADGDVFEVQYRAEVSGVMVGGDEASKASFANQMDHFLSQMKDFIKEQEQRLFDYAVNGAGFFNNGNPNAVEGSLTSGQLNIPDYWSAENTSQRIFEFAISFFDSSSDSAKEYGQTILEAVKKGFEEAMGILGKLPDPVNDLIQETQRKTFEKIDAWVLNQASEEKSPIQPHITEVA